MKRTLVFLSAGIAMTASVTVLAAVVDTLDTTANFFNGFNGTFATNVNPGEVTLFRTQSDIDAGIDWRNGGAGGVDLSLATENLLTITPVAPVNNGFWNVDILFFSSGSFVSEKNWIADTQLTSVQFTNVEQIAIDNSIIADTYLVRIRAQPFSYTGSNPGFSFTEMDAVPEPSTWALTLGALSLLLVKVRRKKA